MELLQILGIGVALSAILSTSYIIGSLVRHEKDNPEMYRGAD